MLVAVDAVVAVVIVVVFTVQQVRRRPVRQRPPVVLNIVLLVYGMVMLGAGVHTVTQHHPLSVETGALLVLSFLVAAGFGLLRAQTMGIQRGEDGVPLRAGTWGTVAIWLAGLAAHLLLDTAIDASAGVGSLGFLTIYLYLGITVMVQNWRVRARARRLPMP